MKKPPAGESKDSPVGDFQSRLAIDLLLGRFDLQFLERLDGGFAVDAGLDGILASDLTVEESGAFVDAMGDVGLSTVFLVAPTSSIERIKRIAKTSTGFLYAVSRTGVTGQQNELPDELAGFIRLLREHTTNPIAVGFGISSPEHVEAVWSEADGAVVGSALVQEIEKGIEARATPSDIAASVGDFIEWLRGGRPQRLA